MLGQGITTLSRKVADRENGRRMSQSNHPAGVWMPGSFIEQGGGGGKEAKKKGHKFCKYLLEWPASGRGCVNFFLPIAIHRWTGSGWFNIQQRGRLP